LDYKTIKLQNCQTNEVRSPALVGSPHPRGKEVEDGLLGLPLQPPQHLRLGILILSMRNGRAEGV